MNTTAVSLDAKLAAVTDHWSPKIVTRFIIEPEGTPNTGDKATAVAKVEI